MDMTSILLIVIGVIVVSILLIGLGIWLLCRAILDRIHENHIIEHRLMGLDDDNEG